MTNARQKEARRWVKNNEKKLRSKLVMPTLSWSTFTFYDDFSGIPLDSYLIDIFYNGARSTVGGPFKTLPIRISWDDIEYVLEGRTVRFPYKITGEDKRVIKRSSKELWDAARKRNGILPLSAAAPILIRNSRN
jgi:hypothetical protein